jgi:hypothetical protein
MIIRNAGLNTTQRTLPREQFRVPVRRAAAAPIDTFDAVAPVAQQQIVARSQPQVTAPASSSSGGFFSNLFGAIKRIAAGWLGQAQTWLSANMGGLIDKAKTFVGGLLTKAGSWFSGLLGSWKTKLES